MTARRYGAEIDRRRAEMRHETMQQRQQAAVEAAREAEDERAATTAKVTELRNLRLARDAARAVGKASGER